MAAASDRLCQLNVPQETGKTKSKVGVITASNYDVSYS